MRANAALGALYDEYGEWYYGLWDADELARKRRSADASLLRAASVRHAQLSACARDLSAHAADRQGALDMADRICKSFKFEEALRMRHKSGYVPPPPKPEAGQPAEAAEDFGVGGSFVPPPVSGRWDKIAAGMATGVPFCPPADCPARWRWPVEPAAAAAADPSLDHDGGFARVLGRQRTPH